MPDFLNNNEIITAAFALVGGVIPALIWLWFWLKEDEKHPEPKTHIAAAFISGAAIVWPVLDIEMRLQGFLGNSLLKYLVWAAVEELGILLIAWIITLRSKEADEPIDYTIYMITTTLGFAALENTLFLWSPDSLSTASSFILTGDLRFIGATLLHVLASGIIGISLSFGFYATKNLKRLFAFIGIAAAIALHTAFNLSIIETDGHYGLIVSGLVWAIVLMLLLALEKVKKLHPTTRFFSK